MKKDVCNKLEKFEAAKTHKISNKYTTERLMMMLDKEKLEALEEEFERHPEGLAPQKFVWYSSLFYLI